MQGESDGCALIQAVALPVQASVFKQQTSACHSKQHTAERFLIFEVDAFFLSLTKEWTKVFQCAYWLRAFEIE